jgi:hypothetical protein
MFRPYPKQLLPLLAGFALMAAAWADTITLKSGEKIEGKVTAENDTELTIEIVSGGVVDERKVPKTDVAKIDKMAADEAAWGVLQNLKLGDNSLPADQYDLFINPLKDFVTKFPDSKHHTDAEQILGDFDGEKTRVVGGEVKLSGKWMTKEEVERERYQISATIAVNYMKSQAARGDAVGAMNTFEIIQKQFDGARAYLEAVGLARQVAASLKAATAQRIAALPAENAERQRGLKANAGLEKVQLKQEIENEQRNNTAALADAKRAGLKWPPFLRRSEAAMKELLKLSTDTQSKLAQVDLAKAAQSIQIAEEVRADLARQDADTAGKKLRQAQQLWPKNELLARLNAEQADLAAAIKAAATPTPTTTPKPTPKPGPKATPVSVNTAPEPAEEPASSSNKLVMIVGVVVFGALAFVGWTAYKKVVRKSNEIIE